ncbi:hypothetical protein BKA62DRAFT_717203 [Auriculariales sp. MPI-PUGE-AT-0066]|nr:hypothetical protein BKA62DRAFT_717203 [Auriculariales sp. MPI-PUGE-AT-0066]
MSPLENAAASVNQLHFSWRICLRIWRCGFLLVLLRSSCSSSNVVLLEVFYVHAPLDFLEERPLTWVVVFL